MHEYVEAGPDDTEVSVPMKWLPLNYSRTISCGALSVALLLLAFPALSGDSTDPDSTVVAWPLDLETRYLTSNFMEYRPGRFHAGLDLKTNSTTGYAALAAEDGWILRVRATPGAYGRAIYVRGASGRTYVYAHLMRFNDPIRALVRARQNESSTYRTRISFQPGEMPVRRGEVLGLTGQSGTNGPHLHFEVRDKKNRPINPHEAGFVVDDRIAPVIHAVRVVPVTASSTIEGEPGARFLSGPLSGDQPVLHLDGPVAFAVKIVDAADVAGHRLEPWVIEVRLDGELVYSCRNERFDFSESSLQRLEWLEVPGIRDRWLHRRPANSLTGRSGRAWHLGPEGGGLAAGDHLLQIRARDHAGNTVEATLPLVVGKGAPQAPLWAAEPVGFAADSLANDMGGNWLSPFFDVSPEEVGGWKIRHLDPAAGDPVHEKCRLGVRFADMGPERLARAREQGLAVLDGAVEYVAADWPISASVPVEMPGAEWVGPDSLGDDTEPRPLVYRWSNRGWKPVDSLLAPAEPGGVPRFRLSNPGLHAVFADVAAPMIHVPDIPLQVALNDSTEAHGVTLPRWEIFPVAMTDEGSGIASETIVVALDTFHLIVEPDLIRDRILIELPDDLAPGRHQMVLEVADEAGHVTREYLLIDCVE